MSRFTAGVAVGSKTFVSRGLGGGLVLGALPSAPRHGFFESHLLCDKVVEHPLRKESEESPVLETLRNDCVACPRFRCGERHMNRFTQTLRGQAISTCFVDDPLLELLNRFPILG